MISREPLDLAEQRVSIRKTALAEVDREVGDRGGCPVVFRESDVAQSGQVDGCQEEGWILSSSRG